MATASPLTAGAVRSWSARRGVPGSGTARCWRSRRIATSCSPLYPTADAGVRRRRRGYQRAYGRYGMVETIRTTIALAARSLAIAMVLGTVLAWAATRLPRG